MRRLNGTACGLCPRYGDTEGSVSLSPETARPEARERGQVCAALVYDRPSSPGVLPILPLLAFRAAGNRLRQSSPRTRWRPSGLPSWREANASSLVRPLSSSLRKVRPCRKPDPHLLRTFLPQMFTVGRARPPPSSASSSSLLFSLRPVQARSTARSSCSTTRRSTVSSRQLHLRSPLELTPGFVCLALLSGTTNLTGAIKTQPWAGVIECVSSRRESVEPAVR